MEKLTQLRTEQGDIQEKIDSLASALEKEKRGMTDTEKTDLKAWEARLAEIQVEAEPLQKLAEMRGKKVEAMPATMVTNPENKEYNKELRNYSLNNVIRARINGTQLEGREKEFAQEVQTRNKGIGVATNNYGVPVEALYKRDITATGTTTETLDQGGQLIETAKPGLIEALGEYMVLGDLGVRTMTGLSGNLSLPKELTKPKATFKAETGAAADQAGLFDTVDLTPNRLPGYINYTHQMLVQPNLAIESYVRQRANESIAYAVQEAFFIGSGASNNPTGVMTTILATGLADLGGQVTETDAGTLDWDSIVDLEALVDSGNALRGNLGYVTNSRMRGKLKTTEMSSGTGLYLWNMMDSATPVNGYKVAITNQIPNTARLADLTGGTATPIMFGNWDHSVLAQWGDVFIDVINSNAGSGYYQIVVNTFWDVAVLQNASFSLLVDVSTQYSFGS